MEYVKDSAVCIIISMLILFLGDKIESSFFAELMKSLLGVVCAIFAINIASTALVAELLQKISEKTGHKFEKSREALMFELKLQGVLILWVILLSVPYYADFTKISSSSFIYQYRDQITYIAKIGLLSIFIYFIWLTHELGKCLFEVLKSNYNSKKGNSNP